VGARTVKGGGELLADAPDELLERGLPIALCVLDLALEPELLLLAALDRRLERLNLPGAWSAPHGA
jgi:hypothetical protein